MKKVKHDTTHQSEKGRTLGAGTFMETTTTKSKYDNTRPECNRDKGIIVRQWDTGDDECRAYSEEYECGAIYNNNYGDVIGNREHECFWDCSKCKYRGE